MQPRVGERFEATVTSALEFGLFVQLKDMPIDGLVHISKLPGDYWELDGGGIGLVGRRTGRRWRLGDALEVRLSRVDLLQRQIDFEPVESAAAVTTGTDAAVDGRASRPRHERSRRGAGGGSRRSSRGGGRGHRG
jgi:ribonuclease R